MNGSVGQTAGTSTFITLAEMDDPQVQVNIDESDMQNFAVGCPAQVSLTSSTAKPMAATVIQVSPELVTVRNVTQVQGLVQLEKTALTGQTLPLGLDVSVDVICKQAQNALEVPSQAVYEPAGQPAYVYVLDAQGNPVKREVVVGLKVTAFDEIKSGLSVGESVVTSRLP